MINVLIHPLLHSPKHKDYKKARIYTWAMAVIGLFLIPYCIYYYIEYPDDVRKNMTNLVFGSLFLVAILLGRFSSEIKYPAIFVSLISYPPVMISVYYTGGIYSVDMVWFFLCIFSQCIFLDYRVGIVASVIVTFYYLYLYLEELALPPENNLFKKYIVEHGSTHQFFTLVFVTLLIVALLSTFAKTLAAANKKLEDFSRERIYTLENGLLEKTKELSQVRQTLAKDFHDEMGNKLASIGLLSQSIGLKIHDQTSPDEIRKLLATIEIRSKELYEGTKDFIWSIDLKSDYTDELFVYIRDFGEIFFEPLQISFYSSYHKTSALPSRLAATHGRQLVYICKEIMTNSAKHAECTEVSLIMNVQEDHLEISLGDNGKGFLVEDTVKRGLRNIEQRINAMNGQYEVVSTSEGTRYKIKLFLNKIP